MVTRLIVVIISVCTNIESLCYIPATDIMLYFSYTSNKKKKIPGDSEGQGSLVCCSPWDRKELDMIEQLNNKNRKKMESSIISEVKYLRYIILLN